MPIFGCCLFLGCYLLVTVLPLFPAEFYYGLIATLIVGGFFAVVFQSKVVPNTYRSNTYINKNGYVMLRREDELEHRFVARQTLGRNLERNEIVHHINGVKIDNRVNNLCVMDAERHEHFHAWLKWKKGKSRFYPPFDVQRRALVEEYNGILLGDVPPSEPPPPPDPEPAAHRQYSEDSRKSEADLQRRLFNELREVRKKLAEENRLPPYMIFYNDTLIEMCEILPESEAMMLQVRGVGPHKYQRYGEPFLAAIKKFVREHSKPRVS